MIQASLQFTISSLNQYLSNRFNLDEPIACLNGIVSADGSVPESNKNKLILSLINIEKETNTPFKNRVQKQFNGNFIQGHSSEKYNLSILLSANFDDYMEALKFLNAGLLFFQTYPTIDKGNFASVPAGIEKLEFDMDKIDYHQLHSLWTSLGAKYQPSVIYKMWLITLESERISGIIPPVYETSNQVRR